MIVVEGKFGIKATILADSTNAQGNRFITFEIEYPRLILAEINTHRMLSKNSFSSRAVPFNKMVEQLTGRPVRFGANQAGMQDKGEDFDALIEGEEFNPAFNCTTYAYTPVQAWDAAKGEAVTWAKAFYKAGLHKQVYNRLVEPFQMMKTVISGTEWENFFWLRDHVAADPTLAELARVMREAKDASTPQELAPGEWHLPYVDTYLYCDGSPGVWYGIYDENEQIVEISLEDAIKVSCARCAAVSYRNEGYGLEKSLEVYDRLVGSDRKHASAFEHCATPMPEEYLPRNTLSSIALNVPHDSSTWQKGITHADRKGQLWSGNLKGFIQYRKLIPGENYEGA
jgi:hypothetical protein